MPHIQPKMELCKVLRMRGKIATPNDTPNATQRPVVYLVDDDPLMREYLVLLFASSGYSVEAYASANEFLQSLDAERPGCLISDVRMPGMGGLELQEYLARHQILIPIIVITGYGDVPLAMRAVRAGALDFIEKPFDNKVLLDRVRQAIEMDMVARQKRSKRQSVLNLIALLTPREHEIMEKLASGKLNNKTLAAELNISRKTLDLHRARILEKMQCQSLVELTRKIQIVTEDQ
jgi:two-component system, LuxR family, response regulator FixJ